MTLFVPGTCHCVWPSLEELHLYFRHTEECSVLLNIDVLQHCLINFSHLLALDPILFMVVFVFSCAFFYFPFLSYVSFCYACFSSLSHPSFHTTVYSMMRISSMFSLILKTDNYTIFFSNARRGSEVGFVGFRRWFCSVSEGSGHVCGPEIGTAFSSSL